MKYKSLIFSMLVGSAGMLSTSALAGGAVGGNCCADLEERVAELEATTAKRGNRRVTVTVSGNVSYALFFNGDDSRFDIAGGGVTGPADSTSIGQTAGMVSKLRFSGRARINSDLTAGYRLEFGLASADYGSFDREIATLQGGPLDIRHNDVFISSKTFGKLSIGQGSAASDFAAEVDLSGTIYFAGGSTDEYHAVSNLDGFSRVERIRYDTPTLAGFRLSTSWQDNDDWDVALRYAGSWGNFTVAGAISYFERGHDSSATQNALETTFKDGDGTVVGSFSVLHRPTGLSLTAAAGDSDYTTLGIQEFWYVKAGLQRKVFSIGKTKMSVDYKDINDGDVEKIGVQFVQDIDAAAMKIYASFWNADSVSTSNLLPDETAGFVGVTINF